MVEFLVVIDWEESKKTGDYGKRGSAIKIDWIIDWFFRRCTWHTYIIFTWGQSPRGWKQTFPFICTRLYLELMSPEVMWPDRWKRTKVIVIKRNCEFFLFLVMDNGRDHPPWRWYTYALHGIWERKKMAMLQEGIKRYILNNYSSRGKAFSWLA